MRDHMAETAAEIDCTFPADGGPAALEEAVERVQREAEDAVRGGCTHVILSDMAISPGRAGLPMILASGAVHSHLVRQQLRTRSEEHTSELQSLIRISYAVFCLKKKKT